MDNSLQQAIKQFVEERYNHGLKNYQSKNSEYQNMLLQLSDLTEQMEKIIRREAPAQLSQEEQQALAEFLKLATAVNFEENIAMYRQGFQDALQLFGAQKLT